jgi:heterodisulfide reductase subunit C
MSDEKITAVDPTFKYEIARIPGGESIKFCFQCGKCEATCPIRRFDDKYRPAQIIRAAILGLRESVLSSKMIWMCAVCFSCTERCPQGVKFTDIMRTIRNIAVREGYIDPFFQQLSNVIAETGRIFPYTAFLDELRSDLGLSPMNTHNCQEMVRLLDRARRRAQSKRSPAAQARINESSQNKGGR